MRTLVIGDIHGGLRALHQIMERAKVTKEDTLIFLGDYVDGWSQSQVLDYLIELNTTNNCVFIRGMMNYCIG
jgi:serine/threonine protein phosphatase 1